MNEINDWILENQNAITFWVAIVSFFLSLLSLGRQFWKERRRLAAYFEIDNRFSCMTITNANEYICISTLFENLSLNPIAITKVTLHISEVVLTSDPIPSFVGHSFRRLIDTETKFYERILESAKFPIELTGLGAAQEFLHFKIASHPDWNRLCKIVVFTNRGKVVLSSNSHLQPLREWLKKSAQVPAQSDSDHIEVPATPASHK